MSYLKNTETNEIITRYVSLRKTQEVSRTVQIALDGTEYLCLLYTSGGLADAYRPSARPVGDI